ncbi:acetylcholine receptor subunit beta [Strigops habroptila]|uniref:acetylcholine receptor subunit beta n=1 Tax=Strigops habroptila TaxID=2489341 RepID=UPI0011D02FB6|nr:acetylcholine receptor subunit beta [Strigops habroptila]
MGPPLTPPPQRWRDPRLQWEPRLFGGLRLLRVPAELLWLPDVGLDNNNDGEFGVSLDVRAVVTPDGSVRWRPPALFRSRCPIRVSHFPFDWQNCSLVFRSGSYGPGELRLSLGGAEDEGGAPGGGGGRVTLPDGFQGEPRGAFPGARLWRAENGQWELRHRSGRHHAGPSHEDVTFYLVLRRKPLFYIATVLVPCVLITLLASAVFYLPPDAGEKLTLALFALLTLTVFLLLLADKVPATSLAVPLIGRYLTATMMLLTLGVTLSVGVLNVHHRAPGTHRLPPWVHRLLLQRLPPLLGLRCPPAPPLPPEPRALLAPPGGADEYFLRRPPPGSLQERWRVAALAMDRLFLWAFLALVGACGLGTGLDAALHRPPPEPFP